MLPADKGNKLKDEAATASSAASASASATAEEKKATDTVKDDDRKLWADELVDPHYLGEDIDLDTLTPEQIPELKRRAALAKEEHERAMAEKRERHAAQEQATLEREIAVEELRLQKLRLREEAEILEGPLRGELERRRESVRGEAMPKQLGGWSQAPPLPDWASPGSILLLLGARSEGQAKVPEPSC